MKLTMTSELKKKDTI